LNIDGDLIERSPEQSAARLREANKALMDVGNNEHGLV